MKWLLRKLLLSSQTRQRNCALLSYSNQDHSLQRKLRISLRYPIHLLCQFRHSLSCKLLSCLISEKISSHRVLLWDFLQSIKAAKMILKSWNLRNHFLNIEKTLCSKFISLWLMNSKRSIGGILWIYYSYRQIHGKFKGLLSKSKTNRNLKILSEDLLPSSHLLIK